ncbi:MAG: glycosyltransferase [Acidimicrobiales bacterium]
MQLAYLVNQYPSPSQTFIRSEIAALERLGVSVERFTVRAPAGALVDPADLAEHARTRAILDEGALAIAKAVLQTAVRSPAAFLAALRLALRLGFRSSRGMVLGLVYLAEACVLVGWLRQSGVTHVHVHFGTNATTVALLARTLGGPPYSFTAHGPEEFDRPEGLKLREKVAGAAFVVAISDYCRSQLFRWSDPSHWDKIHIVHCGLAERFLDSEPEPAIDEPRLVSIGRLCEQKGQLLLVEAIARLAEERPEVQLVLVGDGPMRADVEAAIARSGVGSNIRLAGLLDNHSVRAEILAARATVLPSFAEGLPVVIMESLALGRPVVSTFVAAIPELVDSQCGWLVPAGAVDELVDALRSVLDTDVAVLDSMGEVGRQRARERHDATTEASVLLSLLTRYEDSP